MEKGMAIGDIVYIGGFIGDDFEKINNKVGKIKQIYFLSLNHYSTHVSIIEINNEEYDVNMEYVFDIKNTDGIDYTKHFSGSPSNPLNYYFHKFGVISKPRLAIDDFGRSLLMCDTIYGSIQPLILTSFN